VVSARALFSFLHGNARPTEEQLVGGMLVSEAIHCLRMLSEIEVARVKAESKAARRRGK
jgi:hypothetical protein